MRCEKCNSEHDGSFGSGRFCSRKCANSKKHSEETKQKISSGISKAFSEGRCRWPISVSKERQIKNKNTWANKFKNAKWDDLSVHLKKRRVLIEQENKCLHCGIDEWMGKPIIIELDHVNGNKEDNSRENLRGLCPNCHSQTPTWKKKNAPVVELDIALAF